MIRVSIIIATYNSGRTIRKALNSVVNQIFQEWECLIIDGLSKDNTLQIVKEFAEKDKRIKYISEKDEGVYDAFNKGWKMAQGEWVYYLGSDDRLTPDSFNGLPFYCGKKVGIISGAVERISRLGKSRVCRSCGFRGSHQGQITRKEIIEKINGFDLSFRIVGDFDLNTRIELAGYDVVNSESVIAYFQSGGTSEQFKYLMKATKERYRVYRKNVHYKYPLASAFISYFKNIIYISYSQVYRLICKV